MFLRVDEPTFMVTLGLASFAWCGIFWMLAVVMKSVPEVKHWAWGSLAIGLAMVIDGPRLIEDWQLASLIFNIPLCVGQSFILAGTMLFCRRPNTSWVLWCSSLLALVFTFVFTYPYPSSWWRVLTIDLLQAVVSASIAFVLWRFPDTFSKPIFRIASVAAMLNTGGILYQAMMVASSATPLTYATPELPLANIVSWSGLLFVTLVGNGMLFLLFTLRQVGIQRAAAERDALTGLLNRRGLRFAFDSILENQGSERGPVGIMLLDIDHFKSINDTFGHEVGDNVLKVMGRVLLNMDVPNLTSSRWGGEEFCVLVKNATPDSLTAIAESIRSRFHLASLDVTPEGRTVSIGISLVAVDASFDPSRSIARADEQLYRAKQTGRNRWCMEEQAGK